MRMNRSVKAHIAGISFLLTLSLLWWSCGRDESDGPGAAEGEAIVFSCRQEMSRAAEITDQTLAMFRVSAVWNKPGGGFDEFMDNRLVEKSDGKWVYSPVCYMPSQGTVDFFAYGPVDDQGVEDQMFTDHHTYLLHYKTTATLARQRDLVVALAPGQTSSSVTLDFLHALASVRVEAKCSGAPIAINEIRLVGVKSEGWLTADFSGPETQWQWEATNGTEVSYTLFSGKPIEITSADYTPIVDPNVEGPLMIIPQSGGSYSLSVDYSGGTATFPLPNDFSFMIGESYTLYFTVANGG